MKSYKGQFAENIAFPLGGIGSGNISIAGNGRLVDPEINNHPERESGCGNSGFAVKAEKDGKLLDARMLCGDNFRDLVGTIRNSYGQGSTIHAGFKHFSDVTFNGEFPFAELKFTDTVFPADVTVEAFNPFIPSNDRDSSIPAAFFRITLQNTSDDTVTYSVIQNMSNMLEHRGLHEYKENGKLKTIVLNGSSDDISSLEYGNITIATDEEHTSHTDHWFRGKWFDTATMFMNELVTPGDLKNRTYDEPLPETQRDTASLAATVELKPGEKHTFKFLISWYVPNANCYWIKDGYVYKNYYSTVFKDSSDVAEYCFKNWGRLYSETKTFAKSLYSSSLPEEVLDAISGNLATLKTSTCLRLEDGSFWAWEGVNRKTGSCDGTCQHVYNYAYAMPFLFPKLEKGVRTNEMRCCLEDTGKMGFRMPINLQKRSFWMACVDGQMGFVVKCYREWKLSGDNEWLKSNWESIKLNLEYAWSDKNPHLWDPEKSGVITGRQHHTLDVELFGVYSWLTGMYHAALYAAAEMADFIGETDLAAEYRDICERGRKLLDEKTFNGEYFVQLLDVNDPEPLKKITLDRGDETAYNFYWSKELNQFKCQIGDGCEIDQVLADWHTDLVGLPHVFDQEHRKSALNAIYKYNFRDMHDLNNPCRVFVCNDEKGVVMCQWPETAEKPKIPVPYSEECMTGFEYAVAGNMLQCGMEDKALEIVREIRRRYDGYRRNPFSEIECGASYGRAMASYSLLLTYSGFKFDMPNKTLGFKPLRRGVYFWSVDGAWGTVDCGRYDWIFKVEYGTLELEKFITSMPEVRVMVLNGQPTDFTSENGTVISSFTMNAGDALMLSAE